MSSIGAIPSICLKWEPIILNTWHKDGLTKWRGDSGAFDVRFDPIVLESKKSFRVAVRESVEKLDYSRAGRRLAVAFSGGVDSEIIAAEIVRSGIPSNFYFMDAFGANNLHLGYIEDFERKYGVKIKRVSIDKNRFLEQTAGIVDRTGFWSPHYLLFTHFLEMLPENEFLVLGEGDFSRGRAALYSVEGLQAIKIKYNSLGGTAVLPMHWGDLAFLKWAAEIGRRGEFYFYRNSGDLIASVLSHQALRFGKLGVCKRDVCLESYPEIRPRVSNHTFPKITPFSQQLFNEIKEAVIAKNFSSRPSLCISNIHWRFAES